MANLTLRFSIYTKNTATDIISISKKLSSTNIEDTYSIGEKYGRHIREISTIGYKYEFENIGAIDDVSKAFVSEWKDYAEVLKELHKSEFKSYLLFEFDIADSGFPELVYEPYFLSFLSNIGIELQLFFYT